MMLRSDVHVNVRSMRAVRAPSEPAHLAGALAGLSWFERMVPVFEREVAGLHALDFTDVGLATVSWLREGPVALLTRLGQVGSGVVLVAANAPPLVREEIVVTLDARNCVMLAARVSASLHSTEPELLGTLDPALDQTLKAILATPEFDAKVVVERIAELSLQAANNRLASLEARGVLASERRGRRRVYRQVLEGIRYGN